MKIKLIAILAFTVCAWAQPQTFYQANDPVGPCTPGTIVNTKTNTVWTCSSVTNSWGMASAGAAATVPAAGVLPGTLPGSYSIGGTLSVPNTVLGANPPRPFQGPQIVSQGYLAQGLGGKSNGTDTQRTFRSTLNFPRKTFDLQIPLGNFYYTSNLVQTASAGNAITANGTFEYNGQTYPMTFGGANSVSIPNGGQVVCDPIGVFIDPAVASVGYTRITLTVTSGQFWPLAALGGSGDTFGANGSDLSVGTGPLANSALSAATYTPLGAFGVAYPSPSGGYCITGDSVAAGTGDNVYDGFLTGTVGYITRGLGATLSPIPYTWVQTSIGGTTLAQRITYYNSSAIVRAYSSCKYGLSELGTNDVNAGRSVAAIKADYLTFWGLFAARGIPVYQTTLLPSGSSTDAFQTVSNQTVGANNANRIAINDWIRTVPSPLTGYIEAANQVEVNSANVLTQNGGFWQSNFPAQLNGTATSANGGSITDTTQTWTTNQWSDYTVIITSGTGAGGIATILGNSGTALGTTSFTGGTPGTGSGYRIVKTPTQDGTHPTPFFHQQISTVVTAFAAAHN